jgi:hypothetical protein
MNKIIILLFQFLNSTGYDSNIIKYGSLIIFSIHLFSINL